MTALLHAHSGLRFLVLLLGVVCLVVFGLGLATNKPFSKLHRILGASFAGMLHLQVLLGVTMVAMGRWFPALAGHLAMMLLAAGAAQACMTINRKRAVPGHKLPLLGVVLALVCIFAGLMAIQRGLFTMTVAG